MTTQDLFRCIGDLSDTMIEEAADKAEKQSFRGLFSSTYDKDGLLILKEKHFFD